MGRVLMTGAGGGGGSSDDCTASANDILKGRTAVFNGSDDDIKTGTLELTGSATDGYVYSGMTYYNTDAHTRRTGSMTVGSILNFSAAAYSGRQVLLKWQNPYAAAGRPFGGVFINYSTSGYPGTGGTRIYTGYGNNSSSGGWSQVIVTMPNLGTTYYFSCTAYVPCSAGNIWGNTINGACTTANSFTVTITSSQNYTIPDGYSYVDIFCVGGGGGGGGGDNDSSGAEGGTGGGGGYTVTASNVSVSGGQTLYCAVGSGGTAGTGGGSSLAKQGGTGGTTYVSRDGSWLCSASGGYGGLSAYSYSGSNGGNGGSGGGGISYSYSQGAGSGGTNGGNGNGVSFKGTGQGYTTTAFGENSGTVYSGGGGGGGYGYKGTTPQWGGSGGNYGGGAGGNGTWRSGGSSDEPAYTYARDGWAGTANSGGGGGGAGGNGLTNYRYYGGTGGSGIILLRVK